MDKLKNLARLVRSVAEDLPEEEESVCIHNPTVSKYALSSGDQLAETLTFIVCGHKLPSVEQGAELMYDLDKKELKTIQYVWANRTDICDYICRIIANSPQDQVDFNIFRYIITNIPKIGYSKAGLATQFITGKLGCYDQYGGQEVNVADDKALTAYNNFIEMMQNNADDPRTRKIWEEWCGILSAVLPLMEGKERDMVFESFKRYTEYEDVDMTNNIWLVEYKDLGKISDT